MEHPNAGEDFDRLLNLALLGKEGRSKIDPKSIVKETNNFPSGICCMMPS